MENPKEVFDKIIGATEVSHSLIFKYDAILMQTNYFNKNNNYFVLLTISNILITILSSG